MKGEMAEQQQNTDFDPLKARIGFEQRYLQDLKRLKKEKQAKGELSNGRRKWFNQEADKVRDRIDELIQKKKERDNK
jgi:hypothetical protein